MPRSLEMRSIRPTTMPTIARPAMAIETAAGKREYAELQRGFAECGNALRERVLAAIGAARSVAPRP